MARRHQFASSVMRTAVGLQSHQAGGGLGCKEGEKLCPAQPLAEDALPTRIRTMRMKHVLRDVQADRGYLGHGRLPRLVLNTTTLAQRCRRWGGASTPSPILYKGRNAIERLFGRPKDLCRIANPYDRLATNTKRQAVSKQLLAAYRGSRA